MDKTMGQVAYEALDRGLQKHVWRNGIARPEAPWTGLLDDVRMAWGECAQAVIVEWHGPDTDTDRDAAIARAEKAEAIVRDYGKYTNVCEIIADYHAALDRAEAAEKQLAPCGDGIAKLLEERDGWKVAAAEYECVSKGQTERIVELEKEIAAERERSRIIENNRRILVEERDAASAAEGRCNEALVAAEKERDAAIEKARVLEGNLTAAREDLEAAKIDLAVEKANSRNLRKAEVDSYCMLQREVREIEKRLLDRIAPLEDRIERVNDGARDLFVDKEEKIQALGKRVEAIESKTMPIGPPIHTMRFTGPGRGT